MSRTYFDVLFDDLETRADTCLSGALNSPGAPTEAADCSLPQVLISRFRFIHSMAQGKQHIHALRRIAKSGLKRKATYLKTCRNQTGFCAFPLPDPGLTAR